MYQGAACFACKQLGLWQNTLQQPDISTKHQHQRPKTAQDSPVLSIRFEDLNWHMEMLNKRWYHIHSHQHCPSSVLRAAPQSVSASPYKLYSRPPCIVLNLCFWFRPRIGQSLGIEPVTDVPPDRAARVLSACQELETVA